MEKLIELLNEYGDINWNKAMIEHQDTYIISKKFGFIKWLVENDKIDLYKIPQVMEYSDYTSLLMELSISDNPIQNLVSFLKNV